MTVTVPVQASTYVTGHCANGNHEGAKNLSVGGALFPSCAGEYHFRITKPILCSCWCHELFQQARDAKREAAQDDALTVVIPSMQMAKTLASVDLSDPTHVNPRTSSPVTAPTVQDFWEKVLEHQDLAPTVFGLVSFMVFGVRQKKELKAEASSRRARGSLDINVEAICRLSLDGLIPQELTPGNIGLLIDPLNPPSAGAIHAVLHRWKEAGYCTLQDKPLTMTGFTSKVPASGITGAKKISAREKEARAKGFF